MLWVKCCGAAIGCLPEGHPNSPAVSAVLKEDRTPAWPPRWACQTGPRRTANARSNRPAERQLRESWFVAPLISLNFLLPPPEPATDGALSERNTMFGAAARQPGMEHAGSTQEGKRINY